MVRPVPVFRIIGGACGSVAALALAQAVALSYSGSHKPLTYAAWYLFAVLLAVASAACFLVAKRHRPAPMAQGGNAEDGRGADAASQKTSGDNSPAFQIQDSMITVNHAPPSTPSGESSLRRALASGIAELEGIRIQLLRAEETKELQTKTPDKWQTLLGDLLTDQGWHQSRKVLDDAYFACEDFWERLHVSSRKFEVGPFADMIVPAINDSDDLPGLLRKVQVAIDELRRLQQGTDGDSTPVSPQPPSPDEAVRQLRDVATEYSNAKVIVFPAHQVPMARRIASLFELARWTTNFNETPQEPLHHRYVEGVEISGLNDHLVELVASALKQAGVPSVNKVVTKNPIAPDSAKYQHAVESVRVTIGHIPNLVSRG